MLKKALLASAVLAATSGVAFANGGTYAPVPVEPAHEGGFYIGAAISRDVGDFETTIHPSAFISDELFASDKLTWDQGTSQGVNGEIFLGYGMLFQDHYYLAVEVLGSISSMKGDVNNVFEIATDDDFDAFTADASFRMNNTFGVALIPGFKISDSTLFYGRVGYVNSRFKFNLSTTPEFGIEEHFLDQLSSKKSKGGIQLGLGLETMVTNNVSIRGEYDWNRYGKIDSRDGFAFDCGEDEVCGVDVETSVRPTVDQFKLAAIYHFYS